MKNLSESHTATFCLIWPWVAVALSFGALVMFGRSKDIYLYLGGGTALIVIPVIVSYTWFVIKNKGIHKTK